MSVPTTTLAGNTVGRVGFGLMQLTWVPDGYSDEHAFEVMKTAADMGATAWSSATFYGHSEGGGWDNIELLGRFFKAYPEYIGKVTLVIKGALDMEVRKPNFEIDFLRKQLATIKEKMGANVPIDVFMPAGILPGQDPVQFFTPFEELRKEGLFTAIGASEVSAKTLRAVHAAGITISVVEIEGSLASYDQDIQDVVAWSTETKTPIFAYSPLGRGLLTRRWKTPDDIPDGSVQRQSPCFQGEAFYENLKLVDILDAVAAKKGITSAEVAIAWVLSLSPYTIPIPGSASAARTKDNTAAGNVTLTADELKEINDFLATFNPAGARYPPAFAHPIRLREQRLFKTTKYILAPCSGEVHNHRNRDGEFETEIIHHYCRRCRARADELIAELRTRDSGLAPGEYQIFNILEHPTGEPLSSGAVFVHRTKTDQRLKYSVGDDGRVLWDSGVPGCPPWDKSKSEREAEAGPATTTPPAPETPSGRMVATQPMAIGAQRQRG